MIVGKLSVFSLLLLIVLASARTIMPGVGHAPGVALSAYTIAQPTIDGIVDSNEWTAADTIGFSLPSGAGTLYVMNDAMNLYLAFVVEDDTSNEDDWCEIYFDNDHDGTGPELEDDVILIEHTTTPVFGDSHVSSWLGWTGDEWGVPMGTKDGYGDAQNDGVNSYYELSHPLDSGDIHDFSLSFLDTVGFTMIISTDGISFNMWPAAMWESGSYGDIVIAPPIFVDIRPDSWSNPFNLKDRGVLPVAIYGTEDFVMTVDPASVELTMDGVGVAPLRWSYEDINWDGYLDLMFQFKTQEIIATLGLNALHDGDVITLFLTGNLKAEFGGTLIQGQDDLWIISK